MKTLYGLPEEVKFCKVCVISNQRPNSAVEYQHTAASKKTTIHFDEEGVCDACRVAERKKEIDWNKRELELFELCDRYRKNDGSYDCIVPGSGGKDSFYQSWTLKHRYGMHPLTVTWAPNIYTPWGRHNHTAWINSGQDNITLTPNGRTHRLITRLAIENLFHPFWGFVVSQKSIGARFSSLYKIPLVFYGENEAEYGNPIADTQTSLRAKAFHCSDDIEHITLAGVSVYDLVNRYGLSRADLNPYLPLSANNYPADLQVHYLGYYLKWHPQSAYYHAVEHGGFTAAPERTPGTYSKYNSIDDAIDDWHYWCSGIKFGIGRATYDAAQEIRSGDITRDEGISLVEKYDLEYPQRFSDMLCAHVSLPCKDFPIASAQFADPILTTDKFIAMADRFRSDHLWTKESGQWKLRHAVWHDKTQG